MLGILCTLLTALTCKIFIHSFHAPCFHAQTFPLTFLCVLTDVDAAIVLTQTPAVHSVPTGQEVVLNCNIQRYDSNYVSWYKQVPGEAPQYVLGFHQLLDSLDFGSGFSSDRFNSKSSSSTEYQFIIKRSETGDSAQYYCQTWDDSADEAVSQWFTLWQKPPSETCWRFIDSQLNQTHQIRETASKHWRTTNQFLWRDNSVWSKSNWWS